MKDQALGKVRKVWDDFKAFQPGQKAVTIVAVVALIVGGIAFAMWRSQPHFSPLYSNLDPADASAIVEKLSEDGIPYELAAGGAQILVPSEQVYDARLSMSAEGLPGSSAGGYSLLDQEGITTSEFKQQVDFQRAIEGELSKTIMAIDGVANSTVHLAIPKQDVFNDGSKRPTAAVMLTMRPGANISAAQVQSVVYLVSSAVPELAAEDVTVADSKGNVLAAPGEGLGAIGGTDARSQMTADYNARLASSIQSMLNKALGDGRSVVTVNAELDFDNTSTTTQSYTHEDDMPPVWSEQSTENYAGDRGTGGIIGTGDPIEDATDGEFGGAGTYDKTHTIVTNALGTVTQVVENTPGAVKNLSVAVLLDDATEALNIGAIEALVTSAAGLNMERGDRLAIQSMTFDTSGELAAAEAEAAALAEAEAAAQAEQLQNWIRQGIIAGVILLIVLITWLTSRRRRKAAALAAQQEEDLELITHQLPQGALLPLPDPVPAAPAEPAEDPNASRKALAALAEEEPDEVARVLSGWLSGG